MPTLSKLFQLDGEDLNAWIVREGWALVYRRYSERYVSEEEDT